MMLTPIVFKTRERAKFFEIDPYGHMNTQFYMSHFLEHRMTSLREYLGWDLDYITKLPVAFLVKDLKIEFIRSVLGDKEFEIRSYVVNFQEKLCTVELVMNDCASGKTLSKCTMTLACFDKASSRTVAWPEDLRSKFFINKSEI